MNVFIGYGGFEGSWHGKKLRSALVDRGFSISRNCSDAEIIIAHSGGCFLVPESNCANIMILVGFPYWPGKSIASRIRHKTRIEDKDLLWFKKNFF